MPLPEHLSGKLSHTSSGIPFIVLWDPGFSETFASDAGQMTAQAIVAYEDRLDWATDMVGYADWNGTSPPPPPPPPPGPPVPPTLTTSLQRTLPYQCPLNTDLWCDEVKFLKWGMIAENATPMADPMADNWPVADWVRYSIRFTRPHYFVRSDATLAGSTYAFREQFRFAEISRRAIPREQRQPSMYMEVEASPGEWVTTETAAFTPVCDTEILIKLIEWPVAAFNANAAEQFAGTVNATRFSTGDGWSYAAGELLFKGVQQPLSWFPNANGDFVVSPVLVFTRKEGGWNYQLLPNRDTDDSRLYGRVRLRTVNIAPYCTSEFQTLFIPIAPS